MSFTRPGLGPRQKAIARQLALLTLLCAITGAWSAFRGTDANWDLRNYHLYAGHAWMQGRLGFDIAPAQMQTYFNPLHSLPYFWLVTAWGDHPRLVAFAMGVPAGLYAFALAQIAWIAARRALGPGLLALAAAGVATLLGMSGAGVRPLIGSTMGDVAFAGPIMLALWLALRSAEAPAPRTAWRWRSMLATGLLCGAATGLKLTNVIYAAPLGLLVLLMFGLRAALVAGGAMALAFLAFWGPHALALWREFGSPIFPMYNDIFRSPDFTAARIADERFLPRNWMQAVFYPFYWLRTTSGLVTELSMRDARGAVGFVSAALLAVGLLRPFPQAPGGRRPELLLLLFCVAAYAMWAKMFGIYRYLIVIESLAGVLLLLALGRFLVGRPGRVVAAHAAIAAGLAAFAVLPNWGTIRHPPAVIRFEPLPVPPGALLLLTADDALAYVVPFLPPDVRAIGVRSNLVRPGEEHGLARRIRAAIAGHDGPIWAIGDPRITPASIADALQPHGLALGPCQLVRSTLVREGHAFCEVLRTAPLGG